MALALLPSQKHLFPTDVVKDDIKDELYAGLTAILEESGLSGHLLERALDYAVNFAQQGSIDPPSTDPLTGFVSRDFFTDRVGHALSAARIKNHRIALLVINIDNFKRINDQYGIECGDYVIGMIAERLAACTRRRDNLARISGDEFALLLGDVERQDDISTVASKIIQTLSAPFPREGHHIVLGCSVGVATFPEAGESVEVLMRAADAAMIEAKTLRGSHFRIYQDAQVDSLNSESLERDLRRALRRDEFELHYQPRVELENGNVVGVEALIRWRHPALGLLSPDKFMSTVEEENLILPLGYWVLQRACDDLKRLTDQGIHIDCAVNISFKQIQDSEFVSTVSKIIVDSGVDPRCLEFELTETAVMSDADCTQAGMTALNDLGISFSLDDFGTGYSSFAHLQRLPIAALKIDKSFVDNILSCDDDAVIVKAIISLAKSLQLHVIAEGAETLEQVQFLWQCGCDQVQGYYFSKPLDYTTLLPRLSQS